MQSKNLMVELFRGKLSESESFFHIPRLLMKKKLFKDTKQVVLEGYCNQSIFRKPGKNDSISEANRLRRNISIENYSQSVYSL